MDSPAYFHRPHLPVPHSVHPRADVRGPSEKSARSGPSKWERAWTNRPWMARTLGFRTYDVGLFFIVGVYLVTLLRVNVLAGQVICAFAIAVFYYWRKWDALAINAQTGTEPLLVRSRWMLLLEVVTSLSSSLIFTSWQFEIAQVASVIGWSLVIVLSFRTRHRRLERHPGLELRAFQRSANLASCATLLWLVVVSTGSTQWHEIFRYARFIQAMV